MGIARTFMRLTRGISSALGTDPEGTARATGLFLTTAVTDFVSDTFFTRFGSKLVNLLGGIACLIGSYAAKDTSTKTDLYDLSLRLFRKFLDGRPEDLAEVAEAAREFGRRLGMLDVKGAAELVFQVSEKLGIQFRELGKRLGGLFQPEEAEIVEEGSPAVVAPSATASPELVPPPPPAPEEEKREEKAEAGTEVVVPDRAYHTAIVEV